jgi:hypothetical protein
VQRTFALLFVCASSGFAQIQFPSNQFTAPGSGRPQNIAFPTGSSVNGPAQLIVGNMENAPASSMPDNDPDILVIDVNGARILLQGPLAAGNKPQEGFGDFLDSGLPLAPFAPFMVPTDGCFGDFDGDGDVDVAVAWRSTSGTPQGRVNVYFNEQVLPFSGSPRIGFAPIPRVIPTSGDVVGVGAGDFNNDGALDLMIATGPAAGTPSTLFFAKNNPGTPPTFPLQSLGTLGATEFFTDVATGNIDNTNGTDVVATVTGGGNRMSLNAGAVSTMPAPPSLNLSCLSADIGDFDANGFGDVLLGYNALGATLQAFALPRTAGGFGAFNQLPGGTGSATQLRWLDADGDGDLDVAGIVTLGAAAARTRLYLQTTGTFTDVSAARVEVEVNPSTLVAVPPSALAVADLDLDLDIDILAGYSSFNTPNGNELGAFINQDFQAEMPRVMFINTTVSMDWTSFDAANPPGGTTTIFPFAALLGAGTRPGRTPFAPFGFNSVDPNFVGFGPFTFTSGGSFSSPLVIPNDPNLIGLTWFQQTLFVRTQGSGTVSRASNVTESLIQ